MFYFLNDLIFLGHYENVKKCLFYKSNKKGHSKLSYYSILITQAVSHLYKQQGILQIDRTYLCSFVFAAILANAKKKMPARKKRIPPSKNIYKTLKNQKLNCSVQHIVFLKNDYAVIEIKRDRNVMQSIMPKLHQFYRLVTA